MRTRLSSVAGTVASSVFLVACYVGGSAPSSGDGAADAASCDPAQTPKTGDLPDAVNAVLRGKCQNCHSGPPQNHAPFPLVSFEDTQEPFGITTKVKWQRMAEVVEPAGLPHMPYGTAPPLTADELTTLRVWFAGCAMPIPEGTGHDLLDDGGVED